MDYVIAIPSYKRPETLRRKTLSLLERYNIPKNKINIFVSDDLQKVVYEAVNPGYTFIVGVPGMGAIRNFITSFYPVGAWIVNIDDDISDFKMLENGKLVPVPDMDSVFREGFLTCLLRNARLFGFYPVANGFFMKHTVRYDLRYIIGSMWGIINPGPVLTVTLDDKEDVQRSIIMYLLDGVIVRYENYTPVTAYYKEQGGMMEERTIQRIDLSARAIVSSYTDLSKLKTTKKSGFTEVTLRDSRKNKTFGLSILESYRVPTVST